MADYLWSVNRTTLSSACFALYIASNLLLRSFASPWLGVGWTALVIGFLLAPKSFGQGSVFPALLLLLAVHIAAIPGSLIWGDDNWEATLGVVIWMAPNLLLYLAGTREVLKWLSPIFLSHAILVIYQGFTLPASTPQLTISAAHGLANNPNLAAGLLALGIVYFMTTRRWWWQLLVIPMVVALLFTGSRWGLIVSSVVLVLMTATGQGSRRTIGILFIGLCVAFVLMIIVSPNEYQIAGYKSFAAVRQAVDDSKSRLALPHIPSFLPRGIAEHPGLHNVPLRIAVENGIQAAVLWVGISLRMLIRGFNRAEWWLFFALVLLSLLDYYTWMGHLGGLWWLLLGIAKDRRGAPVHRADHLDIL